MATQTYTDDVIIDGSEDEVQLRIQGHSSQSEALQTWEDSAANVLAQINEDGRFQTGDAGLSTPDALIEAHRDQGSTLPERGFHSLGRMAGIITSAIAWLVSELELVGTATIASIHSSIRARLTHSSSGDSSDAELRAGDFATINQSGTSGTPLGTAIAVQGTVENLEDAYLTKASAIVAHIQNATGADIETAAAIEIAAPVNDGTIDTLIGLDLADIEQGTENYAIRTRKGIIQLGDYIELPQQTSDPANKANVLQFYAKDDKLFAKAPDPDNTIYDLTEGLGGGSSLITATAGEALTANQVGYLNPNDNKIYLLDIDASPLAVNLVRGFVTESVAADASASLQVAGVLAGFSGLTPGQAVYASATAGAVTQTRPEPIHGSNQIAIVPLGTALTATELIVQLAPVQYQRRGALFLDDALSLVHRSDERGYLRRIQAYLTETIVGTEITSYASSNQNVDVPLRDQTISSYGSDLCAAATAIGDMTESGGLSAAFDGNVATYAMKSSTTCVIGSDFGSNKSIRRFSLTESTGSGNIAHPKNFTLQYSPDNSEWHDAQSYSGEINWLNGETRNFNVDVPYTARYWRLNITANNGHYATMLGELTMHEAVFSDGVDKLSQTFNLASSTEIETISLYLKKIGSPTGTLTVRIETTSSGEPTGTLAHANATATLAETVLDSAYAEQQIIFPNSFTLSTGDYAIVLSTDRTASETDYVYWGADASSPSYSSGEMFSEASSTWAAENKDAIFSLYEPGVKNPGSLPIFPWLDNAADLVACYGDGDGADLDTKTTFKCQRQTGFQDITLVVELD